MRFVTVLTLGAAVGGTALAPVSAVAAPSASPGTALQINGRGDGHGVGMPQDGALQMGRAGASAAIILDTFYPGTTIQKSRGAHVHIAVLTVKPTDTAVLLSLPTGGTVTGPTGSLRVPVAGRLTLTQDSGGWTATLLGPRVGSGGRSVPLPADDDPSDPPSAATPASSPTPAANPTADGSGAPTPTDSSAPALFFGRLHSRAPRPSTAGAKPAPKRTTVRGAQLRVVPAQGGTTDLNAQNRSYRGALVTAPGQLVDDVTVEQYLLGLGEVRDPGWPPASLQAQVIAARTYALRAAIAAHDAASPAHVNLCSTDVCQVYLGAGAEYPALTEAVHATDHLAVEYQHMLAATYYSASSGGQTATPAEGFGPTSSSVPYLLPVTYDTGGGDGWHRALDLTAAAHSLGYAGSLTSVEVTARGPSGRVTAVLLHGTAGDLPMTGLAVQTDLKLPSTLFNTGAGLAAPAVNAVGDDSPAAAVGVAFPANQPAAVAVLDAPLPEVAPVTIAATGAVPAPDDAATFSDTFGLVVSDASQLTKLDPAGRAMLVPTTGLARLSPDPWILGHGTALCLLEALLVMVGAAGVGAAWRHRYASGTVSQS